MESGAGSYATRSYHSGQGLATPEWTDTTSVAQRAACQSTPAVLRQLQLPAVAWARQRPVQDDSDVLRGPTECTRRPGRPVWSRPWQLAYRTHVGKVSSAPSKFNPTPIELTTPEMYVVNEQSRMSDRRVDQ